MAEPEDLVVEVGRWVHLRQIGGEGLGAGLWTSFTVASRGSCDWEAGQRPTTLPIVAAALGKREGDVVEVQGQLVKTQWRVVEVRERPPEDAGA